MTDSIVPIGTSKTEYSNVPIGTSNPGCIIILVDQSWSMSEPFGNDGTKAERATQAVNSVIENIVLACRSGDTIRERCHISVIGYGEHVNCVVDGMISEIVSAIIDIQKVKKLIPDGAGGVIEIESEVPIWLEPKANSQTPMHKAFERAAEIIEHWISDRPDAFPPIVINITDGAATRPDLAADAARKIMNSRTTDGASLVFNIHITNKGNIVKPLPHNTDQFSGQMHKAFERAAEIIEHWISDRPDAFPPIVINITDGAATRPDLAADAARKIMNSRTTDGASLVFNIHITNKGNIVKPLPHNTDQFSGQPLAEYLFDISSALPPELFKAAEEAGFSPEPGARCFVYNADEVLMIQLLQFGSTGFTGVRALPAPTD